LRALPGHTLAGANESLASEEVQGIMRWRILLLMLVLLIVLGQPLLTRGWGNSHLVLGQDVTLRQGQRVDGDLVVMGGNLALEPGSAVRGDALVFGGHIVIAGRVDGQVTAASGSIGLDPGAVVTGDVVAAGGIHLDPRATVDGRVLDRTPIAFLPGFWFGWPWAMGLSRSPLVWAVQALLGIVVVVAVGLLVAVALPGPLRTTAAAVTEHPLACMGAGLLTAFLAALVVPILAMTVCGVPLALLIGLAVLSALFFGLVAAGLSLGESLLAAQGQWRVRPSAAVALGLAVLAILLSVPWLAIVVTFVAGAWGLGATVLTRFGAASFSGKPPRVAPPHTG